eukprot:128344-Ditylum_brightwellii.AAC.1
MMAHQPQAAFTCYARSLQFEWTYIQRAIEVKEHIFDPLKDAISSKLLTELFEAKQMPQDLRDLTSLPVWHGGLSTLRPISREAPFNQATSLTSTSHLVEAMMGWEEFKVNAHASAMEHGKLEGQKMKEEEYERVRSEVESEFTPDQCHGVERSTKCPNQWLMVVLNAANNSILGRDKFHDMILLRRHTLQHALQCKVGSLVTAHHNKSRDDLGLTPSQAYTPSVIYNNPKVVTCQECSVEGKCPESAHHQATPDSPVSVIKAKDKEKGPN